MDLLCEEAEMKKFKYYICIFLLVILGGLVLYHESSKFYNMGFNLEQYKIVFYVMCILGTVIVGKTVENKRIIFWGIVLVGVLLICGDLRYSPIDEGNHIDYINEIIYNHKLPTMYECSDADFLNAMNPVDKQGAVGGPRYEAVQVPLYYIMMAILTGWIPNLFIRFIAMRFIGLLLLCGTFLVANKTMKLLIKNGVLKDENLLVLLNFLFIFNPGILVRFVRVSNECLAVFLASVIVYYAVKMICDGYSLKTSIMALICGVLLFYTKSTGALIIGALFLVLIYYKKWFVFWGGGIAYVLSAIPWFIRCKKLYGTLTGMNEHIKIVIDIVNPAREDIDLIPNGLSIFCKNYFVANEVFIGNQLINNLNSFVGISVMIIIICVWIFVVKNIIRYLKHRLRFEYTDEEKKEYIIVTMTIMVVVQIMLLASSAYSSQLDTLIGRYMYFVVIPLMIIVAWFFEKIENEKTTKIFSNILAFFYVSVFLITLNTYIDSIGIQKGYWGKSVEKNFDINPEERVLIEGSDVIEQSFYWDKGSINRVRLYTSTFMQEHKGLLQLSVKAKNDSIIDYAEINTMMLKDNDWNIIEFHNAKNMPDGEYSLCIETSEDLDGELLFYSSEKDVYSEGKLVLNDYEYTGDLNMIIEY